MPTGAGGDHGSFFIPASTLLTSAMLSRPASSRWPPTNRRASTSLFYDQAAEVAHSVNGFITNFLMALTIVVGVLLVFMGVRSGLLLCRWRSTFSAPCLSCISGIELQRISLGALIIALSMLVDNAIVIVEGCSSPVSKALRCWARLTM